MTYAHTPVLLHQAIEALNVQTGCWYIDATLGGGGYTLELLRKKAKVVACDTDGDAIQAARAHIQTVLPDKQENQDYILVHENFRNLEQVVLEYRIEARGLVADLGVSSYQLDTPERGFSYRFQDSRLDMRLNRQEGFSAEDIIRQYSEEKLYEVIATYGEEKCARAIAAALVRARKIAPVNTTGALFRIIQQTVGTRAYETASRVFQAIRMEVNNEIGSLKALLHQAEKVLPSGGRLVVVTFHSLEDRMVKLAMRTSCWQVITKQAIVPDEEEKQNNSRSRSAKLRVAERL